MTQTQNGPGVTLPSGYTVIDVKRTRFPGAEVVIAFQPNNVGEVWYAVSERDIDAPEWYNAYYTMDVLRAAAHFDAKRA